MNKVYACIDGLANSAPVIDWSAWAAKRLELPLTLLHVLERQDSVSDTVDYSGSIGVDSQDILLERLSDLDEKRGSIAQEMGRQLLEAARQRSSAASVPVVEGRLRHGALLDAALELESDARLFVLGENRIVDSRQKVHLGHSVEQVIRSVARPVLVATGETFRAPRRFLLACDGSETARRAVETVAKSPLLRGLPAVLAMAGDQSAHSRQLLDQAHELLATAGFDVNVHLAAGLAEEVLPALVKSEKADLLVMGAYGHSRIRHLVVGSTTTALLRTSTVPVLILR